MIELDHEQLVLLGCSVGLLNALADQLPKGSVLVVEEPDLVRKRGLEPLVQGLPVVSRIVTAEYQTAFDPAALLAREPAIAAAGLVTPGLEYAVCAAAQLADHLGLPGAGPYAGIIFRSKYLMRQVAAAGGLANPAYRLVGDVAEAEAFFEAVGRPCVLKPTNRQASLGVQFVHERAEIAAGWTATIAPDDTLGTADRGLPTGVLIEEALHGPEYSVELLLSAGRVIFRNVTAKRVLPGRFPVELGHTVPADVSAETRAGLLDAAYRLAAAAEFGTGILHSEWIVHDGVPTLVECAARLPGDDIGLLIAMAYDFPLLECYLSILRGETPVLPATATTGAAIEFLTAEPGEVVAVTGVADANRMPGVVATEVDVTPGASVGQVVSSWDRIGQVIARGATAAEAQTRARQAAAAIRVSVR